MRDLYLGPWRGQSADTAEMEVALMDAAEPSRANRSQARDRGAGGRWGGGVGEVTAEDGEVQGGGRWDQRRSANLGGVEPGSGRRPQTNFAEVRKTMCFYYSRVFISYHR